MTSFLRPCRPCLFVSIAVIAACTSSGASGPAPSGAVATTASSVRSGIVDKIDLLFMIDNSVSMGDKQSLLALAIPLMVGRLFNPRCLDSSGNSVSGASAGPDGSCPLGQRAEFPPAHDVHIGIVSSSLGSRGGDVCPESTTNPANTQLSAHNDDHGHLLDRTGVAADPTVEGTLGDAPSPQNFLSYFPAVAANAGQPAPKTPPVTTAAILIADFTSLVEGVHEHGCGFEAQNEAWYRFLIQPDPFQDVAVEGSVATVAGVDETILQQRADFLRPDSLVAVVVVTDENEEAADPLSNQGQGWAMNQGLFPGSRSNGGAPEGTVECRAFDPDHPSTTGPNDPRCTSCAFVDPSSPDFAVECPNDGVNGKGGYLDPANDSPNLRYFHQKQRFGLSSSYPTSRYVRGLQERKVPSVGLAFPGDTDHEHDASGNYVGDGDAQANCDNPLFATNLPRDASGDLCHLTPGPRTQDLVYYAAIAGVPHELLQQDPSNPSSPQKATLSEADWTRIAGRDPEHDDFRGADFHMIESVAPRTHNAGGWANAATCTPTAGARPPLPGAPGADPINGCEYDSRNADLQFACVFPLVQVDARSTIQALTKDCTDPKYGGACDCGPNALDGSSQLCQSTASTSQVYGKAYPSIREMTIAHAMARTPFNGGSSDQAAVSSLCPISLDVGKTVAEAQADPLFGYNPAMASIVDRLKTGLTTQCFAQSLPTDASGDVPCNVLVTLPAGTGGTATTCTHPGAACDPKLGLVGPSAAQGAVLPQAELDRFCQSSANPPSMPVCALAQLSPKAQPGDFQDGSCAASREPGWCYLQGREASALGCAQTIVFSHGEPPHGAIVNLLCPAPPAPANTGSGGG